MEIRCTHCGADVPIQETSEFVKCPFCSAGLFVELAGGIVHYCKQPAVDPATLGSVVQRYLSSLEHTAQAEFQKAQLMFHPYWMFSLKGGRTCLYAASTPPVDEILTLPELSGDLQYCSENVASKGEVIEPELLLDEARSRLRSSGEQRIEEGDGTVSLVHLPFFLVTYRLGSVEYTAWVDGTDGKVLADVLPPAPQGEKSRTLGLVALVSFLLFFVETAKLSNVWLLIAYPVTAAGIFFFSRWLLRRMGW